MEKRGVEKVQKDNLEILLSEFIEKQNQQTKTNNDLVQAVNTLTGKIEQLQNQKEALPIII